jgi:hypothetical protein
LDAGGVTSVKAPYYESRFVRANDPKHPRALWLRSTLLLPKPGAAAADVWVMVFDPDGAGNRALKCPHPIDQSEFDYDAWTARIGDCTVDDSSARGSIVAPAGRTAAWDLRITPGSEAPVKLLTDRAYDAPFPTAKTMVRHPLTRFDGSLDLDDSTIEVDGWIGSVNHNWGRHHTPAYAFGQVCGFDGEPEAGLEIVTARAGIGPLRLPATTLFVLRYGGKEFAVRSIPAARLTRGSYYPFAWSFTGLVDGIELEGKITAEPGDVIGLTYTNTNGKTKYCYNSALATCRLAVCGPRTGDIELTAKRRAMFEILTDDRVDGVPLLA